MLRQSHRRASGKASTTVRKPRFLPRLEALEKRLAPVVGSIAAPPPVLLGTGFDGVVQLTMVGNTGSTTNCTGSLLYTGRHVLTAAHCLTDTLGNIDQVFTTVRFDMGTTANPKPITLGIPPSDYIVHDAWTGNTRQGNDIAILTLPALAPSGPTGTGIGAERYGIYRATNEITREFQVVGYGRTGTGWNGQQVCDTSNPCVKRAGQNRWDADGSILAVAPVNMSPGPAPRLTLAYDFDNGIAANDAFGAAFPDSPELANPGLGNAEASQAQGDSGGPAFIGTLISGVVSASRIRYASPPDIDNVGNNTFGEFAYMTRVSTHAPFIGNNVGKKHNLTLDMTTQVVGDNGTQDQILVRLNGDTKIELWVNGLMYHSFKRADVLKLTIRGSSDADLITIPTGLFLDTVIEGGGGSDQLRLITTTNASYTVSNNNVDIPFADVNYGGIESLFINAIKTDSVDVISTAAGTPVTIVGAGTVNIGKGDTSNIIGDVSVFNLTDPADLTVDDSSANEQKLVFLTSTDIRGFASGVISFFEGGLKSVTIKAGSFSDTINVRGTPQNVNGNLVTTINAGGGDDNINVGSFFDTLDNIKGSLTVSAGSGLDEIHFNDQGTTTAHTYTVAGSKTTRTGIAPITHFGFGDYFLNASQGWDTITVASTSASRGTRINSGDGWDTITIMRNLIATTLTVNAGAGLDTINVGRNNLNGIEGTLDLNGGGGGLDTLNVNDRTGSTGKTYAVLSESLFVATMGILFQGMQEVYVNASPKDDLIKVLSNDATTKLTINGLGGKDEFNLGFENVSGVLGTVNVNGGTEDDTLTVNDLTGNTLARQFIVDGNQLTIKDQGPVFLTSNLSDVQTLTINGGTNQDHFFVYACSPAMAVNLNGGGEQDGFFVGNHTLAGVTGVVKVDGQAGAGWAQILDTAGSAARDYTWTGTALSWDGAIGAVEGANLVYVVVLAGASNDVFHAADQATTSFFVWGRDGVDSLIASDMPNMWKGASGTDYDLLNLNVYYRDVENLVGGSDTDTFAFNPESNSVSTIDGKGGRNTLDYSGWLGDEGISVNVYVNLQAEVATGVTTSITRIHDVIGGLGNDILVGNGGNSLTGGAGHDLLISGSLSSLLLGGEGDDLLIAGTTNYDFDQASLNAIRNHWAGPDSYDTRVTNLLNGVGVPALNDNTATSSGSPDVMMGGADRDVFFGDFSADITDWDEGTESKFAV